MPGATRPDLEASLLTCETGGSYHLEAANGNDQIASTSSGSGFVDDRCDVSSAHTGTTVDCRTVDHLTASCFTKAGIIKKYEKFNELRGWCNNSCASVTFPGLGRRDPDFWVFHLAYETPRNPEKTRRTQVRARIPGLKREYLDLINFFPEFVEFLHWCRNS